MTKTNNVHRKVKVSTSKSRKGLKRPAQKIKIAHFSEAMPEQAQVQIKISKPQTKAQKVQDQAQQDQAQQGQAQQVKVQSQSSQPAKPAKSFDMQSVNAEMKRRAEQRTKKIEVSEQPVISAQKIKEQEIAKAISATNRSLSQKNSRNHYRKMSFGFRRVILAMACAAIAVFAIVYAVDINSPDIPLKVAAMQTGIEAHYPNYIPRGYNLSDVTSESGKITLNFQNSGAGEAFSLIEERSDWNTNVLYNEFVRPTFGDNYTVVSAGGADVYISGSDAAWVSDGIFYRIVTKSGTLTKKQISTIASKL